MSHLCFLKLFVAINSIRGWIHQYWSPDTLLSSHTPLHPNSQPCLTQQVQMRADFLNEKVNYSINLHLT